MFEKNRFMVFLFLISGGFILCSVNPRSDNISDKSNFDNTKYITSVDGILKFHINLWGSVFNPGRIIVDGGDNILTVISLAGGPLDGADLKRVRVYRKSADSNEIILYKVNLKKYMDFGDNTDLVMLKPDDTIFIPQKKSSFIIKNMATLNTFMSLVSLYFSIRGS